MEAIGRAINLQRVLATPAKRQMLADHGLDSTNYYQIPSIETDGLAALTETNGCSWMIWNCAFGWNDDKGSI